MDKGDRLLQCVYMHCTEFADLPSEHPLVEEIGEYLRAKEPVQDKCTCIKHDVKGGPNFYSRNPACPVHGDKVCDECGKKMVPKYFLCEDCSEKL